MRFGISHLHTERASCLHYMARSRGQGHYEKRLKQMARRFSFLLDRVRFAKGWHLGITLGVCMSGSRAGMKRTPQWKD